MDSNLKVVKRNGDTVEFSSDKISAAIAKAFKACEMEDLELIGDSVAAEIRNTLIDIGIKEVSINQIQDMVESRLMRLTSKNPGVAPVARKYIVYRDRRDKDRCSLNKLTTTFHDIIEVEDNNIKKSNANINGNTPAGQMMIFASESSKQHAFDYIVSPKHVQAHKSGYIHIHDADYISTKAVNCNQIDLVELFKKPFIYTVDSDIRRPKRISSYTALAAIVLQSEQNENFGGQSIHSWDYAMAAGVRDSFLENFRKYEELLKENTLYFRDPRVNIGNEDLKEYYPMTYSKALEDTIHQTHEAIAAFIYNMCSMHSRGGGQIVFSSINYGTDDSPEGRIVIDQTLNAIEEGLGNGSTPIFPISVFRVKEGINFSEEDWKLAKENWDDAVAGKLKFKAPNFDLFIKACVVSAHRLFPNFVFEDTPINQNPLWKEDDPDRYKYEIAVMGCRTRVFDNIFGEKSSAKRGNLSFTTINLPRLAIEAKRESSTDRTEDILEIFYEKLDYYMNLCKNQLIDRYNWQCSAYGKQFPFIIKNATIKGMEEISEHDKVKEALKHGTLSIGFIGLAEALKMMTGYHHGESEESQLIGLKIIAHMRKRTDEMTKKENLNFSLFASPAEGLSGRFTTIDRKDFGIIAGVTDREFYTNSNHIPVYYKINAFDKLKLEAPYHELTNAGSIAYVEMDGDPRKNILAFATIVVEMKNQHINYGAINHCNDRCMNCGYEGIIEDECPQCKETESIDRIRRITGYLVGSTDRWNSYKLAELKAREKHL